MPTSTPPTNARERQKRERRLALIEAAQRLVGERGLDDVTVEEISSAAGLSTRTFFNYFDSKDDALLALPDERGFDDLLERVRSVAPGLSLQQIAVRLFAEHVAVGIAPASRHADRHELLSRHPHLFAAGFRRMNEAQDAFAAALRAEAARRGVLEDADPAWANVVIAAAAGATRAVVIQSNHAGEIISAGQIEDRVNALLTTTWENIA